MFVTVVSRAKVKDNVVPSARAEPDHVPIFELDPLTVEITMLQHILLTIFRHFQASLPLVHNSALH